MSENKLILLLAVAAAMAGVLSSGYFALLGAVVKNPTVLESQRERLEASEETVYDCLQRLQDIGYSGYETEPMPGTARTGAAGPLDAATMQRLGCT